MVPDREHGSSGTSGVSGVSRVPVYHAQVNAHNAAHAAAADAPIPFAAVIVMAGSGARFGGSVPKVFRLLAGEPMWAHSVRAFGALPGLTALVLVTSLERTDEVRAACSHPLAVVVAGGARRQDSVRNGLAALTAASDVVAVHDAARPLIRPETILRAVRSAAEHGSGLVAVPVSDTIKDVADGVVVGTPDRGRLWGAQTPQCFRTELLVRAHAAAEREGTHATDDAALIERAGHAVHIVHGDRWNVKVTEAGDLAVAEAVLERRRAGASPEAETQASEGREDLA